MKNKKLLILLILSVILFVSLVLACVQNFNLKKEVAKVNEDFEKVLDNFNLFLIEKVERCESVLLIVGNKTAVVNEVHCKN